MEITIHDYRKISDVQEEFHSVFPYLKLDFSYHPRVQKITSQKRLMLDHLKTLGEFRPLCKNGSISITPHMTVADLEYLFYNNYGLVVQVLRKSGKAWLGTTVTDGWTLEKQNEQGEELSKTHPDLPS